MKRATERHGAKRRLIALLTFQNMPIRRRLALFSAGVSGWFLVIGGVALARAQSLGDGALVLGALLLAHALLAVFAVSITRSLTEPLNGIIGQVRNLTRGDFAELGRVRVRSKGDEIGELSVRFNRLLDALQELNGFKRVIEDDATADEVYLRLGRTFTGHGLTRHRFLEPDRRGRGLTPVGDHRGDEDERMGWCDDAPYADSAACRAFRTGVTASSLAYDHICSCFAGPRGCAHVCIPLMLGGRAGGVAQFLVDGDKQNVADQRARIEVAERFIREAQPVIQSKRLAETLRESAMRDGLTGLYNRRYLEESTTSIEALARRRSTTLGLLMCDIDHFKKVNDEHGHGAGDMVIKAVAAAVAAEMRSSDVAVRYGGEELLAILHDAAGDGARLVAERVRRAVLGLECVAGGDVIKVTMSVGVAVFPDDGGSLWACIKKADAALYEAKAAGRNRVMACSEREPDDPSGSKVARLAG